MIAEVALNIPLRRGFDYLVPEGLVERVKAGARVIVPFGSRLRSGIVTALKDASSVPLAQLRALHEVPDEPVLFSEELLGFTRRLADYYFCGWGEVLEAALPTGMGVRFRSHYSLRAPGAPARVPAGLTPSVWAFVCGTGEWDAKGWQAAGAVEADWAWLQAQSRPGGLVATRLEFAGTRSRPATEKWVRLLGAPPPARGRRNPLRETRREGVLRILQAEGEVPLAHLRSALGDPGAVLRQLAAEGLLEVRQRRVQRRPYAAVGSTPAPFFELNPDQAAASRIVCEALLRPAYRAFLLEGVTGSGKTEIYLHAVREALSAGRDCLVLVPEIALTAAIVERFRSRFGDQVAVLHSGLSEGERFDEWSRIHGGRAPIVIGARSAVFAPLPRLGLVVVDEEHDPSYKQDETPRYNGRDAALLRAYRAGAVALLGSATPSLEATHNVAQGKLERIVLPQRISSRPMPEVQIIGMRQTPRQPGSLMFSRRLVAALRETLLAGDQAILFLNRRGFAQLARCTACDGPVLCAQCSISMTYHQVERRLRCHRCDYARPLPQRCPQCEAQAMEIVGIGTERIEQEVGVMFPEARVLRVDSDTLRRRGELERMLQGIRERAYDVIIGTQILSKGHDFPHITLVGAVLADVSLNLPDFRAAERTFQILTQMAGRAGRGERPGRVLIQTYSERHYALIHVADHDSVSFNAQELEVRRGTNSPPWSSQVLVWVSSPLHAKARALAGEVAAALRRTARPDVVVMGPAEAPIAKLHNRYRWMILLRAPTSARIQPMLQSVLTEGAFKTGAKERIAVDVDPYNLL